ncbi:hypothetical protein EV182_000248 [Spiromyces aspiralis]|uniref:Uncharacterized protein n=1 Tax=Spiromyces aspiralis TaxID=68401 RepID=A0ACC1HKP2_9FUNG|nr:hypothetical protein EV182_000248 [Spiromyces aspiralis]
MVNLALISAVFAGIRRSTGWTFRAALKPPKIKSRKRYNRHLDAAGGDHHHHSRGKTREKKSLSLFQRYLLMGEVIFEFMCRFVSSSHYAVKVDKDECLRHLILERKQLSQQATPDRQSSPVANTIAEATGVSFDAAAAMAAIDLDVTAAMSRVGSIPEPDAEPPAYSPFDPLRGKYVGVPQALPTLSSASSGRSGGSSTSAPSNGLTATYCTASVVSDALKAEESLVISELDSSSSSF